VQMTDMKSLWSRLEKWGQANAPSMLEDLNPGANNEDIALLEQKFGQILPESLKACLRIHNGESDGWPCKVFADRGAFLSTSRIVDEWAQRLEISDSLGGDDEMDREAQIREGVIFVSGTVKPVMFDKAWIPIMECNGDVFWALDFNPADGGVEGQVIEVDWEGCSWTVIAHSFEKLMEDYVDDLESGAFRIDDGQPTKQRRFLT